MERDREPSARESENVKMPATSTDQRNLLMPNTLGALDWEKVEIVDTTSKKMELLMKEAIHIQRTPRERLLYQDKTADITPSSLKIDLPVTPRERLLLRGWQISESCNTTLMKTSSGREACNQERSVEREAQDPAAMEMDS